MDTFKKQYKIYNISSLANFQAYYTGNTNPPADLGADGDIYFKVQN